MAEKVSFTRPAAERIGKVVRIVQKAGVDGRLFGSVTPHDVAEALGKMGHAVSKAQVRMPAGPLKVVGEHAVNVVITP